MGRLQEYSTEVLETELKRRRDMAKIAKELKLPKLVKKSEIDLKPLINVCKQYMEFVQKQYHDDNNFANYIFETAMETLYGSGFWDWHNKYVKNKYKFID